MNLKRLTLFMASIAAVVSASGDGGAHGGEGFSIGEVIFPHFHLSLAGGDSTEDPADLAVGGHDPSNQFTVQGIEVGSSLRLTDNLQGFFTFNFAYGADEEWVEEFEEGFVKLADLPGGFDIRGGRLLNRFGDLNAKHLHSWSTVDQTLVNARMLGDESMVTDGVDLTWNFPLRNPTALTVSFGKSVAHSHDHGHGEEDHEEHDKDHEEHGHEEDHEDHDHDHEEHGDIEEALFARNFMSANFVTRLRSDDFRSYTLTASVAGGDNGYRKQTTVFGAGVTYLWRENGLEPGGKQLSWTTEVMGRRFKMGEHHHEDEEHEGEHEEDHHEEEEHHEEEHEGHSETESDWGFFSNAVYTMNKRTDVGFRVGYISGVDALEAEERYRLSPHVRFWLTDAKNLNVRFQYNYDDLEKSGDAHSAWAQLQYSFGGSEVR